MGMMPVNFEGIEDMFHGLTFEKTSEEIKDKAARKILALNAKITERQKRVVDMRKEHSIEDSDWIQILQAANANRHAQNYTYSKTSAVRSNDNNGPEEKTIGAGVVNFLMTENQHIEAERQSVQQLEQIVANLRPLVRYATGNGKKYQQDSFNLSYEELKFLGFTLPLSNIRISKIRMSKPIPKPKGIKAQ